MGLSALRSVGDAIDATREFMLPASVGRWGKLAVVALFLGTPGTPIPANPQFADPAFWRGPRLPEERAGGPEVDLVAALGFHPLDPATWPAWLLGLALALVAAIVLYVYLGALMRFVFVEALANDAVRVRRDARAHLRGAAGVFALRVVVTAITVPVALAFLVLVAPVSPADVPLVPEVGLLEVGGLAAVALAFGALALLLLVWVVNVATLQFVVPTMVAEGVGVLAGWRRFARTLRAAWREFAVFAVVRLVLGAAVGIAALIGLLVAAALALLVLGTIAAIVVVLAGGLGSLGTGSAAALGVLLLAFLVYAVVAFAVLSVPFQVYLWSYALLVLGDVDDDLDLVGHYREVARAEDRLGAA